MDDLAIFVKNDLHTLKTEFSKRPLFLIALIVVFVSFVYANLFHKSNDLPFNDKDPVTLTGKVLSLKADGSGNVSSLEIKADIPGRGRMKCVCYILRSFSPF